MSLDCRERNERVPMVSFLFQFTELKWNKGANGIFGLRTLSEFKSLTYFFQNMKNDILAS